MQLIQVATQGVLGVKNSWDLNFGRWSQIFLCKGIATQHLRKKANWIKLKKRRRLSYITKTNKESWGHVSTHNQGKSLDFMRLFKF